MTLFTEHLIIKNAQGKRLAIPIIAQQKIRD